MVAHATVACATIRMLRLLHGLSLGADARKGVVYADDHASNQYDQPM